MLAYNYFDQNVEMTLEVSVCGQCVVSEGVVTESSGYDQWVGAGGCCHWVWSMGGGYIFYRNL